MASLSRTYEKEKLLGQVYTPAHIVHKILDGVGYDSAAILGKSILDPACGDGRFLTKIVKRIVKFSSINELENNLSKVHGWDIDQKALTLCEENLNEIINVSGLNIRWNLVKQDALTNLNTADRYDFIVGNPPYIRIQHLLEKQRVFLQSHFDFCASGSTDTFVAFFELANRLLDPDGICGFITPNSYFFSETARTLRNYFQQNKNIIRITNYGSVPIFGKTGTYAAITIFGKSAREQFTYELGDTNFQYEARTINFDELLLNKLWQLSVHEPHKLSSIRLGEICQISVGITTLSDRLYLFKILDQETKDIVRVVSKNGEEVRLEINMLKPIIKASRTKSGEEDISEYVLFPYQKNEDGKHIIIPEITLKTDFPLTYAYLLNQKNTLDKRDNGKINTVAWYAFGRAQSLDTSFGEKIIFSPMNKAPKFIHTTNSEATVYSGYFIKYKGDCQKLIPILNSREMSDYMAIAGRDFRGGWKGYSKKIVENFRLSDVQVVALDI